MAVAFRHRGIEIMLDEDETAIFNSGAFVKLTKDGDVIVRAASGRAVKVADTADGSGAVELATKADVQAIVDKFNSSQHLGAHNSVVTAASDPTGTSVLKAK